MKQNVNIHAHNEIVPQAWFCYTDRMLNSIYQQTCLKSLFTALVVGLSTSVATAQSLSARATDFVGLLDYTLDQPYQLWKGGQKNQSLSYVNRDGEKVAKVTWGVKAQGLAELNLKEKMPLPGFSEGIIIRVPVKKERFPQTNSFGIRVVDANGETWQFGGIELADRSNWQHIDVDLSTKRGLSSWGGSHIGRKTLDPPLKLQSILINAKGLINAPGSVFIGPVQRTAYNESAADDGFALNDLRIRLETRETVKAILVGEEEDIFITVTNPHRKQNQTVKLVAELEHFDGSKSQWASEFVEVPARASVEIPFAPKLSKTGWYAMTPSLVGKNGNVRNNLKPIFFVYFEPAGPRLLPPEDDFWYGMDARIRDHNITWMPAACALIGVDIIRSGINWPGLELQAGRWATEQHRKILQAIKDNGLKTLHSITFTPDWAADPEYVKMKADGEKINGQPVKLSRVPPRLDALEDAVAEIVSINEGMGVPHYDMWNEPDLSGFWQGTTDEYLAFMQTVYNTIKQNDPDALVLSGGIANLGGHGGHGLNPDLIDRMIVENEDYYDAISLHEHTDFDVFVSVIDGRLANLQSSLSEPKPIYFTETGLGISASRTLRAQANAVVKKMTFARSRGALGFIWFVFNRAGGDTGGFAMITEGNQPRPAFAAYNEMVKILRGKIYDAEHDIGKDNYLFEFTDGMETALVLWTEHDTRHYESVLLKTNDPHAQEIDMMGNASPLSIHESIATVKLSSDAKYVKLSGPVDVLGPLIAVNKISYVEPGRTLTAEVILNNPLNREAAYELLWTKPDGSRQKETITLEADSKTRSNIEFAVSASEAGDDNPALHLAYSLTGTPFADEISVPLYVASLINQGGSEDKAPDFIAADANHQYNINENDPNRIAYTWQGPQDISAEIWLSLQEDSLQIEVGVLDDIHVQPHPAATMWKSDSIQLALKLPGINGHWQFGFSLDEDGNQWVYAWQQPAGVSVDYIDTVRLQTERINGGLRYKISLPLEDSGITKEMLTRQAIGINLIVNDDDGGGREGWAFIAPGLGKETDPDKWPLVMFESTTSLAH